MKWVMRFHRIGILVLALLLGACAAQPAAPVTVKPDPAVIARDYPKVDGSTSTEPLHAVVACKIFGVHCAWEQQPPILSVERSIGPDLQDRSTQAETIRRLSDHSGTNSAYLNLIQGQADLIMVARTPSADELKAARERRVELDVRAFALDAFVILENVENPVANLTLDNVRDIYTGKLTDWATLGGQGQIKAYQRDRNSGSQELMESFVMKGAPMIDAPDMMIPTMMGAVNAIRGDRLGIGYSVYYYVTYMLPDENVKFVGINGVKPTAETIANRAYPLTAEVYVVTRKGTSPTSQAIMLRDWLFTKEGAAAITESGYIPIAAQ